VPLPILTGAKPALLAAACFAALLGGCSSRDTVLAEKLAAAEAAAQRAESAAERAETAAKRAPANAAAEAQFEEPEPMEPEERDPPIDNEPPTDNS
jgi:hypothetical protein